MRPDALEFWEDSYDSSAYPVPRQRPECLDALIAEVKRLRHAEGQWLQWGRRLKEAALALDEAASLEACGLTSCDYCRAQRGGGAR